MNLHTLSAGSGGRQRRKRVGRGQGSGTGKTCGRGHKGQMARKGHKHKLGFEGGQMRLIRRIPKRGFNRPIREPSVPVNVGQLGGFEAGSEVTPAMLRSCGLVKGRGPKVKILGQGDLTTKLTVKASAFSAVAREKIEAAGGTCEKLTD